MTMTEEILHTARRSRTSHLTQVRHDVVTNFGCQKVGQTEAIGVSFAFGAWNFYFFKCKTERASENKKKSISWPSPFTGISLYKIEHFLS
jgi:hypothetical protein